MKNILVLVVFIIIFSAIVPADLVLAQDCLEAGSSSVVCNPAPGWFISYKDNSFKGVLFTIIQLLLAIVGIISMAYIIYGGFIYITSRGDEERASAGKKTLTNAIIGLVIVILSYIIVTVIINALKGKV